MPAHPGTLWLLLALVPYALLSASFLARLRAWVSGGADAGLAGRTGSRYLARRAAGALAGALAWALAVMAASGFSAGSRHVSRRADDSGIAVVLDVSNSMLSAESGTSRLDRSLDFIRALRAASPEARWSLVAFKGVPVTLCPATRDGEAFDEALSWAGPGLTDSPGSDYGAAMELAARGAGTGTELLLVVLGDGNDTGGQARLQAARAAGNGATLAFIGAGGPEPSPVVDASGSPVLDAKGRPLSLPLAEEAMDGWARAAGGSYRRLDDPRTFSALASLARETASAPGRWRSILVPVDATPLLAALSLCALGAAVVLSRPPVRRVAGRRP